MARWRPNARERLTQAALELFAERGYENTTVIDIAERAELGKTTFFRHFQDKREVLFGGNNLNEVLAEGIQTAPPTATPLAAVALGLDAVGREFFTADRRATVARRGSVIAANPELQEREALKSRGLIASMTASLERRGVPALSARVAAELGVLAFQIALDRWVDADAEGDVGDFIRAALDEVRAASALS